MRIVEQSQADINNQTRELFLKMKPYLDEGYTFTSALKTVRGSQGNTSSRWYRELREYVQGQGYTVHKSRRNNVKGE